VREQEQAIAAEVESQRAALEAAVTARTKLILLNTPHNPTGTVLTRTELAAVAAVAVERDLLVVTDEVYEHLTFGEPHVPLATLPGMFERTVTISSAGKTFSLTGWKVGWASGPADLVAAVEGAKNWLTYSSGAPLQPAVALALDHHDAFHRALARDLRRKRDRLCEGLADLGMRVYRPAGTYFVTTDVSAYGHVDGRAFCLALPQAAGVVAIPSQVFYDDLDEGRHLVRWAFCKQPEVIDEGLRRLRAGDLRAR
jgi:N-succinyldiaminopimelate aminotransferase